MSTTPVRRIVGTTRQIVTTADGKTLQRSYVYLPAEVWVELHQMARDTGTSVSQIIASFATNGAVNLKDSNEQTAVISKD